MSKGNSPASKAVALIAGPTASGKSDLAIELALHCARSGKSAVVINADSAQVYRDLQVLSARPSEAEMRGIPHRLFGTWDGAVACSAADWAKAAKQEVAEAHAAGSVPILVGGTGLYLRTLLDGIAPIPPIDPAIREEIRSMRVSDAYAALQSEDPGRADQLKPADTTRITRALEIIRSTGMTMEHWQTQMEGGIGDEIKLAPLILLPERERIYERCDQRFVQMLENGAIAEVEALLQRGLPPTQPVMRAIGVREIAGLLQGEYSRDEAIAQGQQATRNYAKRQYTWFRNQTHADWPKVEAENISILNQFEILLRH